jgi:hypothetical protein
MYRVLTRASVQQSTQKEDALLMLDNSRRTPTAVSTTLPPRPEHGRNLRTWFAGLLLLAMAFVLTVAGRAAQYQWSTGHLQPRQRKLVCRIFSPWASNAHPAQ